jgi:hypothetical protein
MTSAAKGKRESQRSILGSEHDKLNTNFYPNSPPTNTLEHTYIPRRSRTETSKLAVSITALIVSKISHILSSKMCVDYRAER